MTKEFNIKINLSYDDELKYNRGIRSGIEYTINDSHFSTSILTPEEKELLIPLNKQNQELYNLAQEIKNNKSDIELLQSYINTLQLRTDNLHKLYVYKTESTIKLANDLLTDITINNKNIFKFEVYRNQ